jgi:hypothetical protein
VVCAAAAQNTGTVAELAADRARRPVPLTDAEAGAMLDRFRAGERLVDRRRSPPADRAGAPPVIVCVGRFAERLPGVVELDINPLIIGAGRGVAADPRIRVVPSPTAGPELRTPRI